MWATKEWGDRKIKDARGRRRFVLARWPAGPALCAQNASQCAACQGEPNSLAAQLCAVAKVTPPYTLYVCTQSVLLTHTAHVHASTGTCTRHALLSGEDEGSRNLGTQGAVMTSALFQPTLRYPFRPVGPGSETSGDGRSRPFLSSISHP